MEEKKFISENAEKTATVLSDFVNDTCADLIGLAYAMSKDHRYLVGKTFEFCMMFIVKLNEDYKNRRYDERNEYACKTANKIIEGLCKDKWLNEYWLNHQVELLNQKMLRNGATSI